ncbi:MAG TPA: sigma 54-interacting transcriptional regulator [Aquabacterium sp.]|nr:sigma 54-interacting transcriptional regulator [Aquabacterium sp.]
MDARKVLCVELDSAFSTEIQSLRSHSWQPLPTTDLNTTRRIVAQHEVHVGLILAHTVSPQSLPELERHLQLSRELEWVGVFDTAALKSPPLREFVLNYLFDYHTHPVQGQELEQTLSHALGRAQLREHDHEDRHASSLGMIGHSGSIEHLRRQIRKVATTDAPVLIGGESGTGKELAANAIHQCSYRATGPFVAVNCGAIAPALIQTELFGHERGAFTGATAGKRGLIEEANGGTIFLDEIADLPLPLQANLLRFLQERTIQRVGSTRHLQVDVRVVAASHVNLANAVTEGRFREDLFYRLNVLPIRVPALRERMTDVPLLAQHFLRRCIANGAPRRVEGFSQQAVAAMMSHTWSGNVRELFNRVQRAVVMSEHRLITPEDLERESSHPASIVDLEAARTMAERDVIELTLGRVDRNITHAARELGISRMTLYRLIDKHGLEGRPHPG